MKKIFTVLAFLISSIAIFGQTELPNMDFENWYQNHYNPIFPNNFYWEPNSDGNWDIWETGNSASKTVNIFPTERTEDAVSGTYAVRMETKNIFGQPAAGNIFTGHFVANMFDSQALFGVPFTGTPDAFRGYYKYTPGNISGAPDTCAIYAILSKWNGSQRIEIAKAELYQHQTVAEYTYFDLMFEYYNSDIPDTISIVLTSSKLGDQFVGGIGSTLYADNLSLFYDLSSVDNKNIEPEIKIYYNNSILRVQKNTTGRANIDLYDITGKKVFSTTVCDYFTELNLPSLLPGVYICVFSESKVNSITQKIMIR
jgi:hypothetical protein